MDTVKPAECALQLLCMSQRKAKLALSPNGRGVVALWSRGVKELTTTEIKQATGDWPQDVIGKYAGLVPAWLFTAVQQVNAPRKSVKLRLSGAYDWSNF